MGEQLKIAISGAGAITDRARIPARLSHRGPDPWAPGPSWFHDPVEACYRSSRSGARVNLPLA
jgi:predicted dehydrogenase